MGSKSTDDLRQELMTQSSIDSYIKENRPYFADRSVTELLSPSMPSVRFTEFTQPTTTNMVNTT